MCLITNNFSAWWSFPLSLCASFRSDPSSTIISMASGDILVHMLKTCLPCVYVLCFVFVFGSVYWCQERAPQIVESCNPGLENMKWIWTTSKTWRTWRMNIEKIENINQKTKNTLFTIKTLSLWLKTLHLPPISLKTIYITANTAKVEKMMTITLGEHDPGSAQDWSDWNCN